MSDRQLIIQRLIARGWNAESAALLVDRADREPVARDIIRRAFLPISVDERDAPEMEWIDTINDQDHQA